MTFTMALNNTLFYKIQYKSCKFLFIAPKSQKCYFNVITDNINKHLTFF